MAIRQLTKTRSSLSNGTAERLARMETNLEHLRDADSGRDELLRQILEEARKTNGRVNRHDTWIAEHEERARQTRESLQSVVALAETHERSMQRSRGAWFAVSTISATIGTVAGLVVAYLK